MTGLQRRICWPLPDRVCLQGGCAYCNDYPFRSVRGLRAYALRHELIEAFEYGQRHRFNKAEVKVK